MEWSDVSGQVVQLINHKLLLAKANRRLSNAEITILKAAWYKQTYDEIAQETGYTASYIQSGLANNLWRLLTDVIGEGENITKSKFRYFMEWKLSTETDSIAHEDVVRSIKCDAVVIGDPPFLRSFYGRKTELQVLKDAVLQNKVVVLSGIAGVGKTALTAELLGNLKSKSEGSFDFLIWKSIYYAPSPENLVTELLKLFPQNRRESGGLASEEARMAKLIDYLQSNRILLVLDEAESLLKNKGLKTFLRRIIEEPHQSCVLLTSCEPFEGISQLELSSRPVKTIKLGGLASEEAVELLKGRGLTITEEWHELINIYQGIPYVIDMIASQVQRLFGGDVKQFYNYKTSLISDYIQKVFSRELNHNDTLSHLKIRILEYITHYADKNNTVSFQELLKGLDEVEDFSILDLKKALEGLVASSVIEVQADLKTREEKYYVNSLIMKYAMQGRLIPTPTRST